jgi:hypothetical protein
VFLKPLWRTELQWLFDVGLSWAGPFRHHRILEEHLLTQVAFFRYMEPENMSPFGQAVKNIFVKFLKTPEQGAATAMFLATDHDVEGASGKYFVDSKISSNINSKAFDLSLRQKLWDLSCEMTGVAFDVEKLASAQLAAA